jgi:AraC-like DNA-binding protein
MPDPEITLLSVFFLVGAAQGVFFAAALFSGKLIDQTASRYLAFLLLILSSELLSEFLDHSQFGLQYIRLMILVFPIDFLYGPLIWLYTSKMCSRPSSGKHLITYLHFIPALIYAPIVWQLMFQPLTGDPNFFIDHPALLEPNQIQSWISPPYAQGLAILHMAIYLFASLWQLHRHSIAIADVFSYREGVALSWLRRLLLALLVLLGLFVVRVFIAEMFAFVDVIDAVLNSAIVIVIYLMAYFAARQPRIFTRRIGYRALKSASSDGEPESGLPQGGEDSIEVESDDEADSRIDKYRKSALDGDMSARILKRLTETMEREKPYLKSNLTLPDLAKMVSTTPNYLSQVINEQLQMNFFDFINSYRIETAKNLIINPLPHTRNILDIAMESAFNSKSAFYSAFKKQMGITPAEYKKSYPR